MFWCSEVITEEEGICENAADFSFQRAIPEMISIEWENPDTKERQTKTKESKQSQRRVNHLQNYYSINSETKDKAEVMPPQHRYNNNFTYVSSCTKYLIFLLNFIFWLFGGLLIGIGLYSGLDKFQATGFVKLDTYYDIILNISIVMVLSGGIVFIVSFCGCLGKCINNISN